MEIGKQLYTSDKTRDWTSRSLAIRMINNSERNSKSKFLICSSGDYFELFVVCTERSLRGKDFLHLRVLSKWSRET